MKVFTADDVIEQFGVVKGSYETVALPKIKAFTVKCRRAGLPKEVLTLDSEPIPAELEWGKPNTSFHCQIINVCTLY